MKRLFSLGLSLAMMLLLVACGGGASNPPDASKPDGSASVSTPDPVTITIGMAATHVEISNIKYHAEKWHELTGNTLDVQAVDDNQFSQLVLTKMTNGGMWDIILGATGTEGSIYNHEKYFADLSGEAWVSRLNDACPSCRSTGKPMASPPAA